jgi:hypothetical protein
MKYLLSLFLLLFTVSINAAVVTRSDDRNYTCLPNDCSLREAVQAGGDVTFAHGLSKITLTNEISLFEDTIIGPGANLLTIDGGAGVNRVFIASGTVNISGVTITGGHAEGSAERGLGGGIFAFNGSLTLNGVVVTGNIAARNAGASGGGIFYNTGNHFIYNSTISNNVSTAFGGAIGNRATLTIVNTTISDHRNAEAITNYFEGVMIIRNATIANNGLAIGNGGGKVDFGNTILGGNNVNFNGTGGNAMISSGGNLFGIASFPSSVNLIFQPSDIRDVDPMLGALQNNGGQTPTHALLEGSPAINNGLNSLVTEPYDQRGGGFERISGGTVDIGAYELQILVSNPDLDNDGIPNVSDNCQTVSNPDQRDTDGDFLGDVCDPDDDNDTVQDTGDNCQFLSNTDQLDFDRDTIGDACDMQTGPATLREQCLSGGYRRFNFPRPFKNERDCLSALTPVRLRFLGWEKGL